MNANRRRGGLSILLSVLCVTTILAADGFDLSWWTVDGGGAGVSNSSTGGSYTLSGTIGQPDANTVVMTGEQFTMTGGFWSVILPVCSAFVPVDFDQDCDVDAADLQVFAACVTGPAIPFDPGHPPPGCLLLVDPDGFIAADRDRDADVDQSDFGIFQRCYSGAGKPADPNCAK